MNTTLKEIEQEIRSAISAELIHTAEFRQSVYKCAETALREIISSQKIYNILIIDTKIKDLSEITARIERDFQESANITSIQEIDETFNKKSNTEFKKIFILFVLITFLSLSLMFGWSVTNKNPPSNSFISNTFINSDATNDGWITLFTPTNMSNLQVSDGITAKYHTDENESYISLVNNGTPNGTVDFEIRKDILSKLRGKKIIFDIQVKPFGDLPSKISVSCNLANLGECKQTQFKIDGQAVNTLLSVQLQDQAPTQTGHLTLIPDIENTKTMIKILTIRVKEDRV